MKPIALLTMCLALALTAPLARTVEEPAFTSEKSYGGFEVRAYPSRLVAEVNVSGPAEKAGNQGFRPLFDYISGKAKGQHQDAKRLACGALFMIA